MIIKDVFSSDVAKLCRDIIWESMKERDVYKENLGSWCNRIGLSKSYDVNDGPPWASILDSPKLNGAISAIVGTDFEKFGTGWVKKLSFPLHFAVASY